MSPEDIAEMFSAFGPVVVRRMFGGTGIYADGVMFALVADGIIYLKAGGSNTAMFDREGLAPFIYVKGDGRQSVMSYRRMPDRLYDDRDELAEWARAAMTVARGQPAAKARTGQLMRRSPRQSTATRSKSRKRVR